jgi:hypothetical protein
MEERMRDTILYLPTLHDIPQKIQSISTSQKSKSESNHRSLTLPIIKYQSSKMKD